MRKLLLVALLLVGPPLSPAAAAEALTSPSPLDQIGKGQTLTRQGQHSEAAAIYNDVITSLLAGKESGGEPVLALCFASALLGDLYLWYMDRGKDALATYRDGLAAISAATTDSSGMFSEELFVQAAQGWLPLLTGEALTHLRRFGEADAAYQQSHAVLGRIAQSRSIGELGALAREALALVEHQRRLAARRAGKRAAAEVQPVPLQVPNSTRKMGMHLIAIGMSALAERGLARPEANLAGSIRASPRSLGAMGMNAALIYEVGARSVPPSVEQALQVYLNRYPDGYFTPELLYNFYEFYRREGRPKDAARVLAELKRYAARNRYALAIGADRRYATPDATWRTYLRALALGDADAALDCLTPSKRPRQRQIFAALGPAGMRQAAQSMGKIQAVREMGDLREYAVTRKQDGQTHVFVVNFVKISEEWKIDEY